MNKNQVEGVAKEVAGKVQQKVGQVIDSPTQQVKGAAKQVEGKTQKAVGDVQQAAHDAVKKK